MPTNLSWKRKRTSNEVSVCFWQIVKFTLILSGVVGVLVGAIWGAVLLKAFAMGVGASLINFWLLRWQVEFVAANYASAKVFVPIIGGYLFRFGLIGIFLYFMGKQGIGSLLAAAFGLLTVRGAIFIYGIFGSF